jgi:hypothetical protein
MYNLYFRDCIILLESEVKSAKLSRKVHTEFQYIKFVSVLNYISFHEAIGESGVIGPSIPNFGIKQRQVVSLMTQPFYPRGNNRRKRNNINAF